jgi:hydrogenase maturation protease
MKRIICIGNRFVPQDAAGFRVYQRLQRRPRPPDVELIDGGLAGLDLLRLLEGVERVVFVDRVDLDGPATVVVLEAEEVAALADERYGHAAGLPYLLRVAPAVCEGPLPDMLLVGIDLDLEQQDGEAALEEAASLALELAAGHGAPQYRERRSA